MTDEIQKLTKATHLTENELKALKLRFNTRFNGTKTVSKEEFVGGSCLKKSSLFVAERLFEIFRPQAIERGVTEGIDFEAYAHMVSTFGPNAPLEEKMFVSFKLFDIDDVNVITKESLTKSVRRVLSDVGYTVVNDQSIKEIVERTFSEFGTDAIDGITFVKFKVLFIRTPMLIHHHTIASWDLLDSTNEIDEEESESVIFTPVIPGNQKSNTSITTSFKDKLKFPSPRPSPRSSPKASPKGSPRVKSHSVTQEQLTPPLYTLFGSESLRLGYEKAIKSTGCSPVGSPRVSHLSITDGKREIIELLQNPKLSNIRDSNNNNNHLNENENGNGTKKTFHKGSKSVGVGVGNVILKNQSFQQDSSTLKRNFSISTLLKRGKSESSLSKKSFSVRLKKGLRQFTWRSTETNTNNNEHQEPTKK